MKLLKKINFIFYFIGVILFSLFPVKAKDISFSSRLTLYGDAKYPENFSHFDYVNPLAPKGGRVIFPAYGSFDNFNPFIFKGNPASEAAYLTLDTLGFSPSDDISTVYPLLAKAFEYPKDKSFVGFILNENAKFSDGSPLTADDVIFSFNMITQKGAPIYKIYYADVDHVEKLNNHHIRFHFKKNSQNKELPLILAQIPVFSQRDWQNKDFSKPYLAPFLGSGPYIIDKFQAGKFVTLKRNPNYWAKDIPSRKGFYNFDTVKYDYYQDTTVTLQALFSGNIDIREEYIAKNWVSAYNNQLIDTHKIVKEEFPHNKAANLQMFVFNLRKDKFKDKRVRQAISLAFDFEWANDKLFYNQYKRLNSYFTNTGMEATGLPSGKELEILNKFRDKLSDEIFTKAPQLPEHNSPQQTRENLKKAVELLQQAGFDFIDGKMVNLKTNEPLTLEIIDNSANGSSFTRVMLPFIQNLKKIGIDAKFRTIEVNIYKNLLDNFDFDMAIISFTTSQLPGNEQKEMWGSSSAYINGSYNIAGVTNPVADELIDGFINAQTKQDYIAYIRAFDRLMLSETYIIPQWYSPNDRAAFANKFEHPITHLKVGFQPFTWWLKEEFRQ